MAYVDDQEHDEMMTEQTENNYVIDFKRILNTADVKKAKNVAFLTSLTGCKLDN